MKRIYYFLVLAFLAVSAVSLVSCKDDDDDKADDQKSLLGVWVCEESLPFYEEGEIVGSSKLYFQFNADGSLIEKDVITEKESGRTYTMTNTYGKWAVNGDKLTLTTSFWEFDNIEKYIDVDDYTYKFQNGKLILTYEDPVTGSVKSASFVHGTMPSDK